MTHHNIDDMAYDMTRARAQAMSDVEEERAERERRRRVAEENRAAYDAAQESNRLRRGGSVSKMEWTPAGGTFSNTTFGPQTGMMPMREQFDWGMQSRVGADFADLARRSSMAQMHNVQIGVDSLSAAMRAALANGGRLPQNLVGILSRNLGLDGKNSSVFSAGFLGNGDFDIDIVTRGANGGLQRTTKKITPREQYGIVNSTPGVWGNDGIAVSQRLYDGLRNTMGKSELPPQGVYAENLRAYNTKKQSADTMKTVLGYYQAIQKEMSGGGKQPMSVADIRMRLAEKIMSDPKLGQAVMRVPDLNDDGTQKMVEDENGNQVPAMRMADPDNEEDQKRVMQNMAMQLNLVPDLRQGRQEGQADQDLARRMAMFDHIYNRVNPPTPPDVAAFQQRQRERQMREVEEAQAREDITRRPQQVINYFKDGRWYSGNGYIRDGKVYDGQGYEIEGATPAEMARGNDGEVFSNERGWVARALPSARELVGGGAGGGNASEGAAQGTRQPAQGEGGVNWTPGHDLRNDGKTYKGTGWLGVLRLPNGGVASEYTVGVEIGGKEIDIPTLVPTLTKEEQDLMVNDIIPNNKDIPDSIMKKAVDFAKMRLANGRSVFANDGTPQQAQQPAQGTQGAQQPQAQGTAQKPAQVEAQSKDKPVPPPDGKQTTEHNNKKYEWRWVNSQNRWAYAPIESAEQKRVKEEASMIRDFRSHGGKYNEDDDGNVSVRIADFDYLPDEDKAKLGSDTLDRIDGEVVFYQAKAKESRRAFQQRREAEQARLRDVAAADRSLRTATKRQKWVDEKMREWDIENDPTLQRKAVRQSSEMSDALMNAL